MKEEERKAMEAFDHLIDTTEEVAKTLKASNLEHVRLAAYAMQDTSNQLLRAQRKFRKSCDGLVGE